MIDIDITRSTEEWRTIEAYTVIMEPGDTLILETPSGYYNEIKNTYSYNITVRIDRKRRFRRRIG